MPTAEEQDPALQLNLLLAELTPLIVRLKHSSAGRRKNKIGAKFGGDSGGWWKTLRISLTSSGSPISSAATGRDTLGRPKASTSDLLIQNSPIYFLSDINPIE